jgi:hypothetical protein
MEIEDKLNWERNVNQLDKTKLIQIEAESHTNEISQVTLINQKLCQSQIALKS